MIQLLLSGGWLMWPILGCSIIAMTIIIERLIALRSQKVVPEELLPNLIHNIQNRSFNKKNLNSLAKSSPLGAILGKGLTEADNGLAAMRQQMEEKGRHVIHELEKYLNSLGTIASIAPLLGLLGTVTGMIQVFAVINLEGTSNTEALAGGIAQALLTTAFGLSVAIPSLIFHRYFNRKIDEYAVIIEEESNKLIEFTQRNANSQIDDYQS